MREKLLSLWQGLQRRAKRSANLVDLSTSNPTSIMSDRHVSWNLNMRPIGPLELSGLPVADRDPLLVGALHRVTSLGRPLMVLPPQTKALPVRERSPTERGALVFWSLRYRLRWGDCAGSRRANMPAPR